MTVSPRPRLPGPLRPPDRGDHRAGPRRRGVRRRLERVRAPAGGRARPGDARHGRYVAERDRLTDRVRRQRAVVGGGRPQREAQGPRQRPRAAARMKVGAVGAAGGEGAAPRSGRSRGWSAVDKPWEGWRLRLRSRRRRGRGDVVADAGGRRRRARRVPPRAGRPRHRRGDRVAITGAERRRQVHAARAPCSAGCPSRRARRGSGRRWWSARSTRRARAFRRAAAARRVHAPAARGLTPEDARTLLAKFGLGRRPRRAPRRRPVAGRAHPRRCWPPLRPAR